jgi:hypothetical protein
MVVCDRDVLEQAYAGAVGSPMLFGVPDSGAYSSR